MQQLGAGLGSLGQSLFKIEQQKQQARDKVSNSQANRDLDEWSMSEIQRMEGTNYNSLDELNADRDGFGERYTLRRNEIKGGLNSRVGSTFEANSNNGFAASQFRINRALHNKEQNMAVAGWGNDVTSLYQTRPPEGSPTHEVWQQKFNEAREAYSFYLDEHDLEATEIQSLINEGRIADAQTRLDSSSKLEPNEIATFKSRINSGSKQADDLLEAKVNEANKSVLDVLVDDPENMGTLNTLPSSLRDVWDAKFVARDAFIKANPDGGDPFINSRAPGIFNAFDTLLDSSSTKVSETDIVNEIGEGLTLADAQFLINKKRNLETDVNKLRTSSPAFSTGVKRIQDAWEKNIIRQPGFVTNSGGEEDEKQNRQYVNGLRDEYQQWATSGPAPKTFGEVDKYINDLLAPHQRLEASGIMERIISNFSREVWVTSPDELESAINGLNKQAREDWNFNKSGRLINIDPWEFLHNWRSPHKIANPQIGTIYKKFAHGDERRAEEMMLRDNWKIPQ